jgi:hypothetical protein
VASKANILIAQSIIVNQAASVLVGSAGSSFIKECTKQNKIGVILSPRQLAILANVIDNHRFSSTLIEAAIVAYTVSNSRVLTAIDNHNKFGALLKDQADELLDMLARWVQRHQEAPKIALTYQTLADIGDANEQVECDENSGRGFPF